MSSHLSGVRAVIGACLGVTGLFTGCRYDSTSPVPSRFEGTYALRSVNRGAVPAVVAEGGGQRYFLLADTLAFSPAGTVARSLTVRHIDATTTPARDTVYRHRPVFPYTVDEQHLTIGYRAPCPANANCIGFEEGTITAARAVVIGRIFWPGEPVLTFVRVPNP